MSQFSLILFDDLTAQNWEPFALTRPGGELLFGTLTFRARAERLCHTRCSLHLGAPHLQGFDEEGAPSVLPPAQAPADGDRLFLLSRLVPDWNVPAAWRSELTRSGAVALDDGSVVGWFARAGDRPPPPEFFLRPDSHRDDPVVRLPGRTLEHVWQLVSDNVEQLARDIAELAPAEPSPSLPPGVHHWGDHPLIVHPSARLEPGCAINTEQGPVWIDEGVTVHAFTRLCGPAYIGRDSSLLGGSIECVSLGPVCKVRGELTSSVCLGYTNKQHEGHMGHAYLGRWVNLGAGTSNSDLKNNYGTIRLWTPAGEVDTGEIKMGSLIGDHAKTGIGLLLNTGTVVGAGCNLYGALMPPRYVPPFSWGTGEELVEYRLDKFLEVADRAMARREVALSDSARAQLQRAWERARQPTGT